MAPALADHVNLADIVRAMVPEARRQEIVSAVVAGLSRGTPLTVICETLGMPVRTLQEWRDKREDISFAIEAARDLGYDWLAHECLTIIDDTDGDVVWDSEGNPRSNPSNVLRAAKRVETRLRLLAKWDPRRYGDSKRVEVSGEVAVTQRHVVDSRSLSEEGRGALRRLLAEAQAQGLLPAPEEDHDVMDVLEGEYHDVTDDDGEPAED